MFVTCFHKFRIYESMNCFHKKRDNFSIEIKNVAKIVYFHKKRHFAAPLQENKTFSWKQFVDSWKYVTNKLNIHVVLVFWLQLVMVFNFDPNIKGKIFPRKHFNDLAHQFTFKSWFPGKIWLYFMQQLRLPTYMNISMTSLLTHTFAHSTRLSFTPKTTHQPLEKFWSLAVSWV